MKKLPFIIGLVVLMAFILFHSACSGSHDADVNVTHDCEELSSEVHDMVRKADVLIAGGHINDGFRILSDAEAIIDVNPGSDTRCVKRRDMYSLLANKAKIFTAYKDYRNAAKYYSRCIGFASNAIDSLLVTLDLSVISCHGGDSVTAKRSAAKLSSFRIEDSLYKQYVCDISQAYIEKFFGNRERSRDLFAHSLAIVRSDGSNPHSRLTPLSELYEYYTYRGDLDSMLFYLNDYKFFADAFRTPDMMADINKGFLKAYILKGDREKALEAFNSYFNIVDSLYNPVGFSVLNSEYSDENLNRTNDRMMKLELTVSRFKMILILIVTLILVGALIWLVCRTLIQSRKRIFFLNREIARKESPVTEAQPVRKSPEGSRQAELMKAIDEVLADPAVYCNPEFNIAELAKLVDSNTKYVSQAINECTGMNFRTFINSLRIKIARVRLTNSVEYSNHTIQAVSESVGFKSTSNFVIAFKKVMGVTPSAYQKLACQDPSFD